jgi:hypothetical protein
MRHHVQTSLVASTSPVNARRGATTAVILTVCALAPAAAHADVLVEYPGTSVACGDQIKLGVWYQAYSGGSRAATIQVLSARKRVLTSKNVRAAATWRYWYYTPRCGRHYYVRYRTGGGTSTFRVWVQN